MKRSIAAGCLLLMLAGTAYARQYTSIDLDDPVYKVLDSLELRGLIPPMPEVKPYTRAQVISALASATGAGSSLSEHERVLIESELERLQYRGGALFESGRITTDTLSGEGIFEMGASISSLQSVPLNSLKEYDSRNMVTAYMRGDISSFMSFNMEAGVRIDKRDTAAWPPYTFTNPGEGHYFTYGTGDVNNNVGYPDASYEGFANGFETSPEVTLSLFDDSLMIRWGMLKRDWGMGSGNLVISDSARSFDAVEGRIELAPWVSYSFLTGTLTRYKDPDGGRPDTYQNMLTTKRIEIELPFGIEVALHETVLWIKRFELGYMNPFMITTLYQNILGDYDNMFAGVDLSISLFDTATLYGSIMTDEMHHANPVLWFKEARDIFAMQLGLHSALQFVPMGSARLQYTRIEPFFYTHRPMEYPTYEEAVSTEYMNKGEPLGYYLPPNSDEFKLELSGMAGPDLSVLSTVQYIRHSGQYGSAMDEPIDYARYEAGGYDQKAFMLYLVEHTFIGSLSAAYSIPESPVALSAAYAYSHSFLREYDTPGGFTEWESFGNHILQLGVTIYGD
ncbi:MAG: hypothetical protein K9M84_05690 [Spirochaetia bacterium]|nr:hypothetical protein [Spirochaetia bacterium]